MGRTMIRHPDWIIWASWEERSFDVWEAARWRSSCAGRWDCGTSADPVKSAKPLPSTSRRPKRWASTSIVARASDDWSADIERAYEVALRIDPGTVWINKHLDLPPDVPFCGAKQSGLGTALGQEGLEEYTQAKIINIAT
jgi:hypothetical protein